MQNDEIYNAYKKAFAHSFQVFTMTLNHRKFDLAF